MTNTFIFANNATTTLAGPIAANATTLNLAAGTGSLFPNPAVGQQFALTLVSQSQSTLREITYCTGRSGDVCTVVRAQEGTTANAYIAGDFASNYLTAATTAAFIQNTQLQAQAGNYAVDTGTVNNIVITLNPAPASLPLIAGTPIRILIANTNTGATTLTVNGLATTTVITQAGAALAAGTIIAGEIFEFFYNPGVGFEVETPLMLLARNNTWTGTQTLTNSNFLSGANTSAASQPLLGVDVTNNTTMFAGPSGAAAWRVVNNANTANLVYSSSTGAFVAAQTVTGNTGVSALTGNVVATAGYTLGQTGVYAVTGPVQAQSGAVIGQTGVEAVTGNVIALAGLVQGQTGVYATTGNVVAQAGIVQGQTGVYAATGPVQAATGQVIGGTGVIATTGGVVASAGDINAVSGNIYSALIIQAGTRLRAVYGITNSGDVNAAPILNDFQSSLGTSGWLNIPCAQSPTGIIIIQWSYQSVTAGQTTLFNLPRAFPTGGLAIVGSLGYLIPTNVISLTLGCQLVNSSQFYATLGAGSTATGSVEGCTFFAIGY